MTALRPSTQLHPDGLADGNVLGLVGTTYGPAQAIKPVGLTGATNPTRYVGGTTTGHPTTGTFVAGDFVVTADGHIWVCSTGGSPGTWVDIAGSGGSGVAVQDEGTALGTATTMNFTGTGVTATFAGSTATVNVPGGGGSLAVLAALTYNPTTAVTKTTTSLFSTAYVDVDATNLAPTFTTPSSTNVLVYATCLIDNNTSAKSTMFALNEGASTIAGTGASATFITNGERVHMLWYLTGLSAGSHTYKLAFAVSGGTGHIYIGGGNSNPNGQATMAVLAA